MKPKLSIGVSILISLALVVFGVLYGNVSGYAGERAQVAALLEGTGGVGAALQYRASDGLNLCVVAERHIPGDPGVAALREAALALRGAGTTPAELKAKDGALAAAFATLAQTLQQSDSLAASARDTRYLAMLTDDFAQYGQSALYTAYNKAAQAFNQKLAMPVLGDVARFFGVKPCDLY
jgi:hypothetical protein